MMEKTNICRHFNQCGGCVFQDIPYHEYLAKKENFIRRAFADYNIEVQIDPIQSVPLHTRRRASFAFYKGHLGFNEKKSHKIVDIQECNLLTPSLCALLNPMRELAKKLNASGDMHVLETPFGIDLHIKMGKEKPDLQLLELLSEFARANNIARLLFNNEPIIQQATLPHPPNVFLQPSLEGEKCLIDLVNKNIGAAKTAIDLFCGTGTFTKPLINAKLKVIGYDCEAQSVAVLGVHGKVRDLFRNPLMPDEFDGIDLVIIDPPRAGAKAQIDNLKLTNVPKIIMISCNPSTCARDTKALLDFGWKLEKITPVDQFTFSNHIELVCILSK